MPGRRCGAEIWHPADPKSSGQPTAILALSARELAELPGEYVSPAGALLVARCDGQPGGCVAMRPLGTGVCEMKRLHVRHAFRGKGVGRRLVETIVAIARAAGYRAMRVNALSWMREIIAGYRSLGFEPIPPHRRHGIAGLQPLELDLTQTPPAVATLRRLCEPRPLMGHRRGPLRVS